MGGPFDDTLAPRVSPARPARRVTFHRDTMFRDSTDPTRGGRTRLEESAVSGPGGAAVPPPRARTPAAPAPPSPPLPPSPPRESGISSGTTYPAYSPPRAAQRPRPGPAAGIELPRNQPQQQSPPQSRKQRPASAGPGGRAASRERQPQPQPRRDAGGRVAAAAVAAAPTAAVRSREAAMERAMQMYRRVGLEQRYLAGEGGNGGAGGGSGWDKFIAGGLPAPTATAGGGGGGRGPPVSPPRQSQPQQLQQKLAAARPRVATPTAARRPTGPATAAGSSGGSGAGGRTLPARPVTHLQQQSYMADLAARQAASERQQRAGAAAAAAAPRPPASVPAARQQAAAELAAAADWAQQQAAGHQAQWTAAAEGRTAPGLGGPPAQTQGPLGMPVARVRRQLEARGVPGRPSTAGLSPREAALARAAAYMSGRGATGPVLFGGEAAGRGQGPVATAVPGGGGGGAGGAALPRSSSVGVQAAPEHAPRAPRVMSAPAGGIGADGRSGSRRRGSSGRAARSTVAAAAVVAGVAAVGPTAVAAAAVGGGGSGVPGPRAAGWQYDGRAAAGKLFRRLRSAGDRCGGCFDSPCGLGNRR
ncbi:hypothetical protein PLESTM_001603200 [Pleodorina starrii]|nr:hypothetical protein PLESTM_001603200 [Pleodorina starrii]